MSTENRLREIATGLAFPEGPIAMPDGSVVLVESRRGTLTRVLQSGELDRGRERDEPRRFASSEPG